MIESAQKIAKGSLGELPSLNDWIEKVKAANEIEKMVRNDLAQFSRKERSVDGELFLLVSPKFCSSFVLEISCIPEFFFINQFHTTSQISQKS